MGFKYVKSILPPRTYYLSGSEAIAEGALAAGCRYFGGYPITPATDIAEMFSVKAKEVGGVFIQMEDEIASISSVIGASWAGAKAMTATSGPGFSLMQEAIGFAAITETPLVIALIQRVSPSTGQGTLPGSGEIMQAKWGSHGDYQVIALYPWSVQEMYDFTIRSFNLAEQYRVPVILLGEALISRLEERIEVTEKVQVFDRELETGITPLNLGLGDNRVQPMPIFGGGHQVKASGSTRGYYYGGMPDAEVHAKLMDRIHNKILDNRDEIIQYDSHYMEDARAVVVAYGFTARSALYAVKAMRQDGQKVGMLRLKNIWPFPDRLIEGLDSDVKIFVPEMNRGQVAGEVKKYTCAEVVSYTRTNGEVILPDTIAEEVRRLL